MNAIALLLAGFCNQQEVFKPTLQYLKAEQFDAARTNTNYITRFFNLKKKIDKFIVLASDVVDDADEVGASYTVANIRYSRNSVLHF